MTLTSGWWSVRSIRLRDWAVQVATARARRREWKGIPSDLVDPEGVADWALIQFWRSAWRIRKEPRAYLVGIIEVLLAAAARSAGIALIRHRIDPSDPDALDPPDPSARPDVTEGERHEAREFDERVQQYFEEAIARVRSPVERDVLAIALLYGRDNLNFEALAQEMGVQPATLRKRLSRARASLLAILRDRPLPRPPAEE